MSQCVDECPVGFTADATLKTCSDTNINSFSLQDYPSSNTSLETDIKVTIGGTETFNINLSASIKSNLCGFDTSTTDIVGEFVKDYLVPNTQKIKLSILNQNNLSVTTSSSTPNIHPYFGIRELSVFAYNCKQSNCITCNSDTECTKCSTGFVLLSKSCQQCNAMCETCVNTANECINCKFNKIWNSTTKTCDCPAGTYWSSPSCVPCPTSNCSLCSQTTPYNCSKCSSGFYLQGNSCGTSCNEGYFKNTTNNTCDACVANCKSCSNASTCNQCLDNVYMTPSLLCTSACTSGQYTDTVNKKCIACAITQCATCDTDYNVCTKCSNSYYLQIQTCVLTCDPGYYADTDTKKCVTCSSKISNCSTCTSTLCNQCAPSYYLLNGKCESACPPGYFSSVSNAINVCNQCQNSKCYTCVANSNNCLTCNSLTGNPYKQGDFCVDKCSSNYLLKGDLCVLCSTEYTGCQTCTPTQCLTCTNSTHYLNQISNTCSTICPSNTYKQIVTGGQNLCTQCDPQCLTCGNSSTNCLTCPTTVQYQYQQGDKCKSVCDPKYYSDSTNICKSCSSKFSQCGNCDTNHCVDCNDPSFYLIANENRCVSSCPTGYVISSSSPKTCIKCGSKCLTCQPTSPNSCITCYTNSTSQYPYYLNNDCLSNCGSHYYSDSLNICYPCTKKNADCIECNSQKCLQCNSPLLLDTANYSCISSCNPVSSTPREFSGMCVANCTDPKCLQCSILDTSQCQECDPSVNLQGYNCQNDCDPGYFAEFDDNTCVGCVTKYSDCQECNSKICTKCTDPLKVFDPSSNNCMDDCSSGYYKDPGDYSIGCQQCTNITCKTCDYLNPQACITCNQFGSDTLLEDDTCVSSCSIKYYQVGTNCVKCPLGCETCDSIGCLSCLLNYFLHGSQCVSQCPDKTYHEEVGGVRKCISCTNQDCKLCELIDKNLCTECISGSSLEYLEDNQCKGNCSSGYISNSKICEKCSDVYHNCSICDSNKCLSCLPNSYYNHTSQKCVSVCEEKYYGSNQWECLPCSSNCLSCDSLNCFICDENSFLQNNSCVAVCNTGYYGDVNDQTCQLCSNKFLNCSECTTLACLTCNHSTLYLNKSTNECIPSCNLDGHYVDIEPNGQQACYRCSNQDCKTCNTNGDCLSCFDPSQKPYLNINKTCVNECPIVYDHIIGLCSTACTYPYVPNLSTKLCVLCSDFIYQEKCYQYCPQGTVQNPNLTQTCVDCQTLISDCSECTQDTTNLSDVSCTKCNNSYLQTDGKCNIACPFSQFKDKLEKKCVINCDISNGYFEDNVTQSCQQCDLTQCKECSQTNDKCTKCQFGKYLNLDDQSCYSICPDGKYANQQTNTCDNCSSGCLECYDQSNCIKCNSLILYQGVCYTICPSGTFEYMNECILSCPQGFLPDSLKNQCIRCQDNCTSCGQLSKCDQCNDGYTIKVKFSTAPICSNCSLGYYENICVKCSPQCLKCEENNSPGDIQCIVCSENNGYFLIDGKCLYCRGNVDETYDFSLNKCTKTFNPIGPTPSLKVSEEIKLQNGKIIITAKLTFDKKVKIIHSNWVLKLDLPKKDSYKITHSLQTLENQNKEILLDNLSIFITIIISSEYQDSYSTLYLDFTDSSSVVEENGGHLTKTILSSPLPKIVKANSNSSSPSEIIVKTMLTTTQMIFLVASPFYMVISFFDLIQMMNYLLYLNVQYPSFLNSVIQIFDFANFEMIPNVEKANPQSPYKFRIEKVDTFIYSNLIQSICVWGSSYLIFLACRALALSKRFKHNNNFLIKNAKLYYENYKYKVIIGLGYLTYCDLFLAVLLQFYDISKISVIEIIGTLTSIVLLVLIVGLNFLSFKATKINVSDLTIKNSVKKIYGFLYDGFTLNNSKPLLNFIFLIRKSAIIYQLVFHQEDPLQQTFIFSLMIGFETTFMAITKPYRNKKELFIQILSRFFLIFSLIFILALGMDDSLQKFSTETRNNLGVLTSVILIGLYLIQFTYNLWQAYISYKMQQSLPEVGQFASLNK